MAGHKGRWYCITSSRTFHTQRTIICDSLHCRKQQFATQHILLDSRHYSPLNDVLTLDASATVVHSINSLWRAMVAPQNNTTSTRKSMRETPFAIED